MRGNHVAVDTSSVSPANFTGRPKEHGNNVSRTFAQQKVSLSSRAKTRARASPRSNQPPLPLSCPHGRPYLPDRVRRFIPSSQPQPQPHVRPRPSAWWSAPGKVQGGAEKLLVQNQSASSSRALVHLHICKVKRERQGQVRSCRHANGEPALGRRRKM